MNFLDLIMSVSFSTPSLPPLPPEPDPLPSVDQSEEDKKKRIRTAGLNKRGHSSLITNQGGAGGLLEEQTDKAKTLGGSNTV
jgi:hypothetical protein